jgi:ELWxxDGT repeat protein
MFLCWWLPTQRHLSRVAERTVRRCSRFIRPQVEPLDERTLPSAVPVDFFPGFRSYSPDQLTAVGDKLFFTAADATHGRELWVLDGSGAHFLLPNRGGIAAGSLRSDPKNLTPVGNLLYFTADDQITGRQLYRTDGNSFEQITAFPSGVNFQELCNVNGTLYFDATRATPGDSLWKIAKKVYGNGNLWTKIHEANKDQIPNPDLIHPGQVLTLPKP